MTLSLTTKLALLAALALIVIAGLATALFHQLRQRRAFHSSQEAMGIRPARVHLEQTMSAPSRRVRRCVEALRQLGFRVIGIYRIPELDLHLVGLGHPQDQIGAAILETADKNWTVDVMAQYANGGILTVTTASNPGYPNHPGHEKIFVRPGTSPKKLYGRLRGSLGSRDLLSIHPGNFASFFEATYARDAGWHHEQIGPRDIILRDPELDALSEPVFQRLKDRDAAGVQDFLKLGFSPEGRDSLGQTPLMVAIGTGEASLVRTLLDGGADPNARAPGIPGLPLLDNPARATQEAFVTPLSLAIEIGVPAVIATVLGAGANLEGPGIPPLHFASGEGDLDMVRAVIEAGAEVNRTDNDGMTPLHHAAVEGFAEVVEFLVSVGADLESRFGKKTAISLAAEAGAAEVVELLELYVKRNQVKKARKILEKAESIGDVRARRLVNAARNGRTPMVRKLLAAGIPPDAREYEDELATTPLIAATRGGHVDAMRALIEGGANVNGLGPDDESVLSQALRTRPMENAAEQAEALRLLVRYGADLSSLDEKQRTFVERCVHETGL